MNVHITYCPKVKTNYLMIAGTWLQVKKVMLVRHEASRLIVE